MPCYKIGYPLKGLSTVAVLGIILFMALVLSSANAESVEPKADVAVLPFYTKTPSLSYLGSAVEEILSGDLASLGVPVMDPACLRDKISKKSAVNGPDTEFVIKGTVKASSGGLILDIGLLRKGSSTPLFSQNIKAANQEDLALKIQNISRQLADKIQESRNGMSNPSISGHGLGNTVSRGILQEEGAPETRDLLLARIHPDKLLREPIKVPSTPPVGGTIKPGTIQPYKRPVPAQPSKQETITGHNHTPKNNDEGEWTPDYPPEIEEAPAKGTRGARVTENQQPGSEENAWTPDYPPVEPEGKGNKSASTAISPVQATQGQEKKGWFGWLKAPWAKRAEPKKQKTVIVTSRRELPFPPPVDVDLSTTRAGAGGMASASTTNSIALPRGKTALPTKAVPAPRSTAGKGGWFSWLRGLSNHNQVKSPGSAVASSKHLATTPSSHSGLKETGKEGPAEAPSDQNQQVPIWQWY